MLTDQSLSDAVIALQRQDLTPETRDVVEEAARLLSEGRDGEARALVEKAEALASLHDSAKESPEAEETPEAHLQQVVAPLAAKLTAGFSGLLTSVLEELHRYTAGQIQDVTRSLQEQIDSMDAAVCDVATVGEQLSRITDEQQTRIESIQKGQQDIWSALGVLQQAREEQGESLRRVAGAADELSRHLASEVEAIAARFGSLEERVSLLDQIAEELQPQLSGVISRLDRHTDALRALEQRHTQRVSTLNQMLDSLVRLKEPEAPEIALSALA